MQNNKILKIQPLPMSPLLNDVIRHLPQIGKIKTTSALFSYLDIDDGFIHHIYSLLDYPNLSKPDYFSQETNYLGAHISIIYPEENTKLDQREENKPITFNIAGLFTANLAEKKYFVLGVNAPDLIKIRQNHGLPSQLQLKGYFIDLHITVATSPS